MRVIENSNTGFIPDYNTIGNDAIALDTEEQIRNVYGEWFCEKIGIEHLLKMPRVAAQALNLQETNKYPECKVRVEHLPTDSVVKGIDGHKRPFIAIKLEYYDNPANVIVQCVEVILKRYAITDDGAKGGAFENVYVSALNNQCSDGESRESVFYQTGATHDWSQMRNLMNGKLVRTELMKARGGYVQLKA